MAWVGQCRTAFEVTVKSKLLSQKKKKVLPVLKSLSQESDIPLGTLRRWWQEVKMTENGQNDKNVIDRDGSGKKVSPDVPICPICKINPVRIKLDRGKKRISRSCSKCEDRRRSLKKKYKVMCAHCGCENFYYQSDLILIKEEGEK